MTYLVLLILLLPSLAFAADAKPGKTRINNVCTSYAMCYQQTNTGECTTGTDEIVHHVGFRAEYAVYSTKSTATDYSCDIFTNNEGYAGGVPTSDQVNTTSITDEEPVYLMLALLRYIWVTCNPITGGYVTIDFEICGK